MNASGTYWQSVHRLFEITATRLGLDGGQRWKRSTLPSPAAPPVKQLTLFPDTPAPSQYHYP